MPTVREATPEDVPAIRRVHAASVRGLAAGHYDDRQIDAWSDVDEGDYALPAEGSRVVVAEATGGAGRDDGDRPVVGFGALDLESGEVRAVYVHVDHAGTGVGSAILRELETAASDAGLTDLRLTASLNAVPFYERHGWVATEPTTHELGDGVGLEAQAMEKLLDRG
jgi:putative acetyltransferase